MTNIYTIRPHRVFRRRVLWGIFHNGKLVEGGFHSQAEAEEHAAIMELQSNNNAQEGK
jgi:hypothetical protein